MRILAHINFAYTRRGYLAIMLYNGRAFAVGSHERSRASERLWGGSKSWSRCVLDIEVHTHACYYSRQNIGTVTGVRD